MTVLLSVLHVVTTLTLPAVPPPRAVPAARAVSHPVLRPVSPPVSHPVLRPAMRTGAVTPATVVVRGVTVGALTQAVQRYCGQCHNPTSKRGNLDLRGYTVEGAAADAAVTEKMIRKLRAGMMPPPGSRRPAGDTLLALVETLETLVDNAAPVNPGRRTFQRLNRAEYERVVRDLLGLQVNAGEWLPLDTKSANFDNVSDAQALSPTLLEGYLNAAAAISRMAVGDRTTGVLQTLYKTSPFASQHPWDHVPGTPYGTRGGMVFTHTFPADGEYVLRLNIGGGVGRWTEDVDISVDGRQVALLRYDKGIARNNESADFPLGADYFSTAPLKIKAGQRTVSVAFVRTAEGPYEDLIKPHDWSRASSGTAAAGSTEPPPLLEVLLVGPSRVTGISDDAPARRALFSCRPGARAAMAVQRACAEEILTRLATRAYRRPLTATDRRALLAFYDRGASTAKGEEAFEAGVRMGVQAVLASPHFVFRFERAPATAAVGTDYALDDLALASRLSFFLWSSIPDQRLLELARTRQLSRPAVLNAEVRRMLRDPRAEALATRFAAQWLRLQDLDKVHPDAFLFPDYDQAITDAMHQETALFFADLVKRDRSVLWTFTADSTFVNERLARHYGMPGISGEHFRPVAYADAARRGVLGQGSVLVQTSLGNRTSPVLRGKWVMEVLLGTPPPPPPPNVPDLEQTVGAKDGRTLTTRERMEVHRSNATCKSCHQYIDPLGLALDGFDVTGRLRHRENGAQLDTRGQLWDGQAVSTPGELVKALTARPLPLLRTFTENLMTYALGRRVEDHDQPTVRAITRAAAAQDHRFSAYVLGVVNSKAFRTARVEPVAADASQP
jgi:hypothetical protein